MPEEKRTRSSVRPQRRRRRVTENNENMEDSPDDSFDSAPPDAPVDSVVVISPPTYPDPPAGSSGRPRASEDDFGANLDENVMFPENRAAPNSSVTDDMNDGGMPVGDGGPREGGTADGDQSFHRRRRRRRRRGGDRNGDMNNSPPPQYGRQRTYGQQRDFGQQRQFSGGPPPRQYGGQRDYGQQRDQYRQRVQRPRNDEIVPNEQTSTLEGVLELHPKGYGFLRDPKKNYSSQESDPFVSSSLIEKAGLREGVWVRGEVGSGARGQGPRLKTVETIDGMTAEDYQKVKKFDDLTAITPHTRIRLETGARPITMRVMDLLTPVGKGQRALIVAPPRTGKTVLLQEIADAVSKNHPDMHLMVLLIDERPEEVTEMRRHVHGEVIASSMDRDVESHVRISQLIIERGRRLAEEGKDVFILLDSITRTARAFNKWTNTGRTATGGLDVRALDVPKKMFGTARQFDEGGSLTIVATALIDTGSRADESIFQEFKGTGNMELVLSRDLADRRIWPSIDITKSGTRHEEKLYDPSQFDSIVMLRRSLISLSPVEAMEQLTRILERYSTNTEFLEKVKSVL